MRAARVVGCVALLAAACSSSEAAREERPSFRSDVLPILETSCALATCHGNPTETFGISLRTSDPNAVYAELMRESPTAKGLKFVVPGDPTRSFLYAKVVGAQGDFSDLCTMPGCGETMPPGRKIPSIERESIRQWIAAGAKP